MHRFSVNSISNLAGSKDSISIDLDKSNKQSSLHNKKSLRFLILLLLSPVLGVIFRKILPGQSIIIEIGFSAIGLFLMSGYILINYGKKKYNIPLLLSLWIVFNIIYLIPGFNIDYRIPITSFVTRIMPLFLPIAAYYCINGIKDYVSICRLFSFISIIQLPIGIWVAIYGIGSLPSLFQPLQEYALSGKGIRAGFYECVGFFSTPSTFSGGLLVSLFLALSGYIFDNKKWRYIYLISIASSILLLFLSTRRGAFMLALVGIAVWFVFISKNRFRAMILVILTLFLLGLIDSFSVQEMSRDHETRLGHFASGLELIGIRIERYFIELIIYWARVLPYGSFLGSAGREGRVFGYIDDDTMMVEAGGPQLVAEVGILGLIFFPLMVIHTALSVIKGVKSKSVRQANLILNTFFILYAVMFYSKEMLCLNTLSISHLFFWITPGINQALINCDRISISTKR